MDQGTANYYNHVAVESLTPLSSNIFSFNLYALNFIITITVAWYNDQKKTMIVRLNKLMYQTMTIFILIQRGRKLHVIASCMLYNYLMASNITTFVFLFLQSPVYILHFL